jgi:hypothetical protein
MALFGKDDATNRLLAKHPRASGDLLEKLSHSSDKATRQGVAGNPNTAPETLVRLGQQLPQEFLANPALDLLLMVNPALMEEVPEALLVRLLKQDDCPASLLTWAAGHPQAKVQLAVAMNAEVPEQAREKLASSKHQAVREAVQTSANTLAFQDPELAFEVAVRERLESTDLTVIQEAWASGDIGLAQWSALPISFRLEIATDGKYETVLSEGRLSNAVSEKFASDPHPGIRRLIAENPSTPSHVLEKLANDENRDVRWAVAKNLSIPERTKEALARDKDFLKHINIAQNPNSSALALEAFAKDTNSKIRNAVAENPSTPLHVIELLVNDKNNNVRSSVAKRPESTASLLEVLANDKDVLVRLNVASNPSTPVHVLEDFWRAAEKWMPQELAQNPSTPVHILESLAKDSNSVVRNKIAQNPNTPTYVLAALIKEKNISGGMRVALASNAHRSDEIFQKLRNDSHKDVRSAVRRCKGLTSEALETLFQEARDEGDWVDLLLNPGLSSKCAKLIMEGLFDRPAIDSPWFQCELSQVSAEIRTVAESGSVLSYPGKDPNKAVLANRALAPLMALCAGPFIEPSRLVKVVGSTDWLVRAAVARNPGTPPNLLRKLSADAHPLVAVLAQTTLRKEEGAHACVLDQPAVGLDLRRAAKEILGRIPNTGMRELFMGLSNLFTDDVWCEQLTVGQISWMTAALVKAQGKISTIADFPPLQRSLDPEQAALMVETAVALEKGLGTVDSYVRMWAAEEPASPVHVLRSLADDADPGIVLATMGNPAFPTEEMEPTRQRLLKLRGKQLLALLENKAAPSEILEAKSTSKDRDVRKAIAGNSSTPVHVLGALARDSDASVRQSVAANTSTPVSVLESLARDSNAWVRLSVAENTSTPVSVLEALARDSDASVRQSVAANTSTPVAVLEVLAKDKVERVRRLVARNPLAPVSLLVSLVEDTSLEIRAAVSLNQPDRADLRERFLNWWLARLQRSIEREIGVRRGGVAEPRISVLPVDLLRALDQLGLVSPDDDNKTLTKASRSKDWLTRLGVALHPSATEGILKLLRQDCDPDVARAAAISRSTIQISNSVLEDTASAT